MIRPLAALALPGTAPAASRLHAKPDTTSAVLLSLKPGTKLDIKSCTTTQCSVTVSGKAGWMLRPQVKAGPFNCAALITVSLRDLPRRGQLQPRPGPGQGPTRVRHAAVSERGLQEVYAY
ncbi:hypothetical protein [Deinococcus sp. NW-56]|uniref:hypothetical protein n=1 Tax=Deinococcus sp. NW-56 TaxID=2080419 RepID=UPI000CF3AC65|nr:hypothetical protein [Deinococcus sp. NW-56]